MWSRIVTFNSKDLCRRVALFKTDEEMTELSLELSSKPMALILHEGEVSACTPPHLSLEPEILHIRKGMIVVG